VEVLPNGRVGEVQVNKSSGYETLDYCAVEAVKKWKFIPAKKGGAAIPCWVNIPFKFQLLYWKD
jgi:protein TonB